MNLNQDYLILGGAALLFIILVIVIVMRSRRKRQAYDPYGYDDAGTQPYATQPEERGEAIAEVHMPPAIPNPEVTAAIQGTAAPAAAQAAQESATPIAPQQQEAPKAEIPKETYGTLRQRALNIKPQDIGLDEADARLHGVVMDWDLGGNIVTLAAFRTGDASLYFSNGGGIIGGGQHEAVSAAAKSFVKKANDYKNKAAMIPVRPAPDMESVTFYLLSREGIYGAQENLTHFYDGSSSWAELFEEANNVIAELRIISESNAAA